MGEMEVWFGRMTKWVSTEVQREEVKTRRCWDVWVCQETKCPCANTQRLTDENLGAISRDSAPQPRPQPETTHCKQDSNHQSWTAKDEEMEGLLHRLEQQWCWHEAVVKLDLGEKSDSSEETEVGAGPGAVEERSKRGNGGGEVTPTPPPPPPPLPPPYSNTLPRHPMPPRAERMERVEKKLGRGKGTNQGRGQNRADRARRKWCRAQKEEKERK